MKKKILMLIVSLAVAITVVHSVNTIKTNAATTNGWQKTGGEWYYYEDGAYATGWKKINNVWYYFNQNTGAMFIGSHEIGGINYAFSNSGALIQNGWGKYTIYDTEGNNSYNEWFYSDSNGKVTSGWKKINGTWYYFWQSGSMCIGANPEGYVFDESGALHEKAGFITVEEVYSSKYGGDKLYYCCSVNHIYYVDNTGKSVYSGELVQIDNNWYHFGLGYYAETGAVNIEDYSTYDGTVENARHYLFDEEGKQIREVGLQSVTVINSSTGEYKIEYYYLNSDYECLFGWATIDGEQRYFSPNMVVDSRFSVGAFNTPDPENYPEDGIYYFDNNGNIFEPDGWCTLGDNGYGAGQTTYYFENGEPVTGWKTISGTKYYFDYDGAWAHDGFYFVYDSSWNWTSTMYFESDGSLATDGWHKISAPKNGCFSSLSIEGKWIYIENGEVIYSGWHKINGTWYYFEEFCMQTNIILYNEPSREYAQYAVGSSGAQMQNGWIYGTYNRISNWYYIDNGVAVRDSWKKIGNSWYYFEHTGAMATGWKLIGGTWYYFNASGTMSTGWQKIGSSWYYFYDSGAMASNTTIDGYTLSSSGAWV